MNIYGKLAEARKNFHKLDIKKSGRNDFQNYKYFALDDFLVQGMQCMRESGLVPVVSFTDEFATMNVYETDGDGVFTVTSPMASANLKGCHPVQNVGACETYQRRYLWTALLELIESDAIESAPMEESEPMATQAQRDKIVGYQEEGVLPKRREAWMRKTDDMGRSNWNTMTFNHAETIIDECKKIAGETV